MPAILRHAVAPLPLPARLGLTQHLLHELFCRSLVCACACSSVLQAIERVNDLDPEILEQGHELFFHLQQQRLIELIRQGQLAEALEYAQEYLAPRGEDHPELLQDLGALVASCRLYRFSKTLAGLARPAAPGVPFYLPGFAWPGERAVGGLALPFCQRCCQPCECLVLCAERTAALLVFEDVGSSPLADLMDVAQRQKTASELNAAILASQSQVRCVARCGLRCIISTEQCSCVRMSPHKLRLHRHDAAVTTAHCFPLCSAGGRAQAAQPPQAADVGSEAVGREGSVSASG